MRFASRFSVLLAVLCAAPAASALAADRPASGKPTADSGRAAAIAKLEQLAAKKSLNESCLELTLAAGRIVDPDLDAAGVRRQIEAMAREIRQQTVGKTSPDESAAAMRKVIFVDHGFSTPATGAPILSGENALEFYALHRYIKTRKAHCEGLATLYLVVGEAAGLPVSICNAPIHTYARLENRRSHVNVECTAGGTLRPDAAMHSMNGAKPAAVGSKTYFCPLTKRQFLCLQINSIAYGLAKQSGGPAPLDIRQMVRLAEIIEQLDPDHPESVDTAALIHAQAGDYARAARIEQHVLDKANEFGTTSEIMAYFRDTLNQYKARRKAA